jgi:hypothetical protein
MTVVARSLRFKLSLYVAPAASVRLWVDPQQMVFWTEFLPIFQTSCSSVCDTSRLRVTSPSLSVGRPALHPPQSLIATSLTIVAHGDEWMRVHW